MGAAKYVGRVGGLAVALGVGTAIVSGQGVALADEGTTGSSNSANSSASDSSRSGPAKPGPAKPGPAKPGPAPNAATGSTTTSSADTTPSTKTTSTETTSTKTTSTKTTKPSEPELPSLPTEPTPTATPRPTTTAPTPTDVELPSETPKPPTAEPTPTASSKPARGNDSPPKAAPPADPTPIESIADPGPAALPQNKSVALTAAKIATIPTIPTVSTASVAKVSAATVSQPTATVARSEDGQPSTAVDSRNPLTIVTNAVANLVNWVMGPVAATAPTGPVENPLGWTLLAFIRREFENFVAAVGGTRTTTTPITTPIMTPTTLAAETTSLALAATPSAAAAAVNVPNFPLPGTQFSPSTSFVNWVTGNYQTGNPLIGDTANRFGIWGTDVGVAWDNGMVDDPTTPWNEHQILMAFGDTFSGPNMSGIWRFNTLLRTSDTNLANGLEVPQGEWFNGNMFGGAPLSNPTFARPIINPTTGLPTGVTLIPTAGISVPTPGTRFGVTQYVNFMSVSQWGAAGSWTTSYSGIAYSTDNGENFTIAPSSIRYNQPWGGNQNFQQGAFVRPGDGYVYSYGTPNGRQGAAYVSRVAEKDILDLTKYEYYSKGSTGFFGFGATSAGWYKNNPGAATPVFGAEGGACGATKAGNTVSELSVQYNQQLKKYITLYGDQNNAIVMRTSDTPQGGWSDAKVLMTQQQGGIYAPMMIPSSPSTMGTGSDLYWNLSLYSEYNVMLMKTDLSKV